MNTPLWHDLVRAFALLLILEGLGPFLSPTRWRDMILRVSSLDDRMLRGFGLAMMIGGVIVLQVT